MKILLLVETFSKRVTGIFITLKMISHSTFKAEIIATVTFLFETRRHEWLAI